MSKQNREKRKRKREPIQSTIQDHKRIGKELIAPFNTIEKMTPSSWMHDYAPEMLWAFLLTAVIPRRAYLSTFRNVADWARRVYPPKDSESAAVTSSPTPPPIPATEMQAIDCEVDHTSIAGVTDEQFKTLFAILGKHPLAYAALRPLLLLDSLPGIGRWRSVFDVRPGADDWRTLADGITYSFHHQSEQSTDIRWLKLVTKALCGKLKFPMEMRDRAEELFHFPEKGDMRSVRPFIRSGEITFRRHPPTAWVNAFWAELMTKTACIEPSKEKEYSKLAPPSLHVSAIFEARKQIIARFHSVKSSKRVDARLDSTFGFALYAISLLEEIAAPPISQLLLGRMGLRSIAEIVITFSYLLKKDAHASWDTYRNYGTGIAKLAFMKLEEATGDAPSFVDSETLHEIANEDVWLEFVNVNLGNWANLSVRELAIVGGSKEIYDAFYDWTSTFSHGQWGAVRDSNFITCHNPLHRLHRIPRPFHRLMPSVVADAIMLVNKTMELLEQAYPRMGALGRVAVVTPQKSDASKPPTKSQ